MGKKGELLRLQKKQAAVYTFTGEQLEEHDRKVIDAAREKMKQRLVEELEQEFAAREQHVKEVIEQEWKFREELFSREGGMDNFFTILSLLLAISCRVLVERFHWKPIPPGGYCDRRNRLMRFGDYVVGEIEAIQSDEMKDIRKYCEEVRDKYGVEFRYEEVEVQEDERGKATGTAD